MLAPFYALQPVFATNETLPYPGVAHAAGSGLSDPVCQPNISSWSIFPVGLQNYNVTTNRAIYNLYKEMINKYPTMGSASVVQFENYAQQGVQAVDPDSTAYPHREDYLLVYVHLNQPITQTPLSFPLHSSTILTQQPPKLLRTRLAPPRAKPSGHRKRIRTPSSSPISRGRRAGTSAEYLRQLCVYGRDARDALRV